MLVIKTTGVEDYMEGGEAYVKALIMGAPSAGKTRSASYWPKPIFADCEKGRMSIADRGVPYGEILTVADMDKLLEILAQECKKPRVERKYQTLVIDTVDAYQRIVIKERLDAEKKEALSGWGDWGYLDAKMTQFISKLHALPMNIIVNVHVKEFSEGEGDAKTSSTGVKLKGDLKDQIAAEFDLVGFMGTYWEAEAGERVLKRGIQWQPDPTKPVLKDRSGQLPKWTNVSFSEDDYTTLFSTLISHLDNMQNSQVLETHETDNVVSIAEPKPPVKGGPVASKPPAAPLPKAAPAAAPASSPAPKAAAPVPAATKPAAAVSGAEAIAAEKAAAAAKLKEQQAAHQKAQMERIQNSAAPTAAPGTTPTPVATVPVAEKPTAAPASSPVAPVSGAEAAPEPEQPGDLETSAPTPVQAQEPVAEPASEVELTPEQVAEAMGGAVISETDAADDSPAETAAEETVEPTTDEGSQAVFCGTGFEGGEPQANGCGTEIITEEHGGDQNFMQVEIAQLKTRTNLCNACFAAWRAANKKG